MALNVDALTGYVQERRDELIRKAVVEARTSKEFNLQTGIKGATNLNLLDTTVVFQDGSACGWSESGTSTVSKRILTPGVIKINMSFCDKQLLKTWMNYDVRIAAGQKNLPFEEDFIGNVIENVKAELEKELWQNSSAATFEGFISIAEAASLADTVEYSSASTIASRVNAVYAALPSAVFSKGDVKLYMGSDDYRKYVQELIANGNLVLNAGNGAVLDGIAMPERMLIPGTNVMIVPVAGLDATHKMFASYSDNFIYGTDLQGDEEKFEFWYSQDNREFRLAIEFNAGVQVAYPDMLVEGKEA